jgi:hypothetical protein
MVFDFTVEEEVFSGDRESGISEDLNGNRANKQKTSDRGMAILLPAGSVPLTAELVWCPAPGGGEGKKSAIG